MRRVGHRDVLSQGPAEGHVEHLEAAADAEDRDPAVDGPASERELPGVGPRRAEVVAALVDRSVGDRVDVVTAAEDQPVEAVTREIVDLAHLAARCR